MAETMGTPELEKEGVRKSIIQKRLNDYKRKVYGLTEEQKTELARDIETVSRIIERLVREYDEMPDESKKEQIDRNVEKRNIMQKELDNPGPTVAENSAEYYRMKDVIPELEDILAKADPDLEFVPVEDLTRRLEEQRRLKEQLEKAQKEGSVVVNEEEIRRITAEIEQYTIEITKITGFIDNPESAREELLRRKEELEKRIAQIEDALKNGKSLSNDRENIEKEIADKEAQLKDLKRQLDEEIKKHNRAELSREVVFNGIDDTHDAQAELNRIAQELNISPSELEIDWHEGANDYGDNVATEFDIVRVKRNEPILTVAERENAENELRIAEEELAKLTENGNPEISIDNAIDFINAEILRLTDQIVANNEAAYGRDETRVELNAPLEKQRNALIQRRNLLNGLKNKDVKSNQEQINEIDAELIKIRDQIVANNEAAYGRDETRVELNAPLDARRRELENKKRELKAKQTKGRNLEEYLGEIDAELIKIRDQIVANNEAAYGRDETRVELNAPLEARRKELEDIKRAIKTSLKETVVEDPNAARKQELASKIQELKDKLAKDDERRAQNPRIVELDNQIKEVSGQIKELKEKLEKDAQGLSDEERAKLEQELTDKNAELTKVKEALENPEKTKAFFVVEKQRIELLIVNLREEITRLTTVTKTDGIDNSEQIRIAENKIKELEELIQLKEKFKVKPPVEKGDKIDIPELPHTDFALDEEKVIDEYNRRKHDMYAKYYGDKDYQKEYNERAQRYRSHEVPARTEDGIEYMTIEDYEERAEDEKFLLLEFYKEALERYTKSEAGLPVYEGTEEEIARQKDRDREYIETRNYTFDQHKFTQKDLATMGKYGEKVPYIPKQEGVLKNIGRALGNTLIFARNVVAPVHRAIGKYIAQPIHRLVTGEKDASPYRNNFTHRITARRIYFEKMAQQADMEETRRRRENAEPGEEVKEVKHPIKNWFTSRWKSIFNAKEGNRALLNAGEYDIQQNIMRQETQAIYVRNRNEDNRIMEEQIRHLEEELERNPNAENAAEVKEAIAERRRLIDQKNKEIAKIGGKKEITIQTDAIDYQTQGIARKELNTFRYGVIRGVARAATAKFVGPAIRKWLIEHTMEEKTIQVPTKIEQWVEGRVEETVVPKFEDRLAGGRDVSDAIADRAGTQYTGFYSVSGGEVGPRPCVLGADDKITGWWIDNGTQWGTGVSDRVGLTASKFTDRFAEAGLLDANGLFRQDVSPDEILRICQMEGVDPSKIYVSVGDNHWAKALDIFGTERVKVGEEIVKKYIPGHMTYVDGFKDQVVQVPNTRVEKVLDAMGIAYTGAAIAGTAQDVYENVRRTDSKKPNNKTNDKLNPPAKGETPEEKENRLRRRYERDAAAAALFGNEAHPESKAEYEAQFRRGVTAILEEDEEEMEI